MIPTLEPTSLHAGDSYSWSKSFGSYNQNDGWALSYYIRGAQSYPIASTADGSGWLVSVATAATSLYVPDNYRLIGLVTNPDTGGRVVVYNGPLRVLPDPTSLTSPFDVESHARKVFRAITAVIEGKATHDQLAYQVNGRSITKLSWDELLRVRDYYAGLVRQDDMADGVGGFQKKNVLIRFNRP